MLEFTFWKVFLKGKVFTFIRVPPMAVVVMAVVIIMAVAVVRVAVVMAPGKGFEKNPKKSSLWRKEGFPLGLLI